ncbi:probable serine/threonine-protein kinase DDB_G0282963 isoform X2 [Tetranychus urticae]|uniref:probable serine/threonine-protein kinase DDB_G0282963 isoform X2 n=1 Tax=Tetranychus urticae TaxID=32264 RepID=UPI000D64227D|nr:probable serine/threonine-protein kinase DDB_G0282963 isoform X2 [Tetranychus urticae]
MVSTHVKTETDSHDSDNLISLHVNGLSIYEPTRGQIIKTWKVPSSNGYYFHRVEFVSHSHHVEFVPRDKQPIDQVKENPTLHSLLIDHTLVTKPPPEDDFPDTKTQPTANFTSVIKRTQSCFGGSSKSAAPVSSTSVITNVNSNRISIDDNNDKNNNLIDIAESSNSSNSIAGGVSNNTEKANFNNHSSTSANTNNIDHTKNVPVVPENNVDNLDPNTVNSISSVNDFTNVIEPNKRSITSEESEGPRGIESDFRLQRIYGVVDKKIVRFGSYTVMERRRKHGAKVSPDPEIFNDIENASDWGEEEILPKANDLTKKQISSIKKAMAKGRLFNMGASVIVKLFPKFSTQSIVTSTGKVKVNGYRCPLCSESDANRRKIIRHIETEHTMNQIICIDCKSIFTTDHSARFHICSDKKEVNNRSKPGPQSEATSASDTARESNQSPAINNEIDKNDHEMLSHTDDHHQQNSAVKQRTGTENVSEVCESNSHNQSRLETLPSDENSLEKQSSSLELLLEHNYGAGGYEDSNLDGASQCAEDDFLSIQDIGDASIEDEVDSNKKSEDRNYTPNIKNTFLERYHGTIDKRLARTASNAVIQRRKNNVSLIQPDPNVFTDLDGVEEWDEKDIIPNSRELTSSDINRIKKGIKNGKLYNIGASLLVKIFPSLSSVNYTTKTGLIRNAGYKCPLCPKENNIKRKLFRHIEADHTMSLIICTLCRALFTSEHNSKSHQCTIRPSTRASSTQNDQDHESEVLQPINSSDVKDNPTTFITTIINSNKSNITGNVSSINKHNDTPYPSDGFSGSVIRTPSKSNNGEFSFNFPKLTDTVAYQPDRGIKRKLSPYDSRSSTYYNNQGVSSKGNNDFGESDSEEDSSSSSIIEEEDSEQESNLSLVNKTNVSSMLQNINDDSWSWTYDYQTSKTNALADLDSSLNDDEMINLEEADESLKRIFGQIDSTQLPTRTRNCVTKRQDYVKHIQPEPSIFSDLEGVEEWKPNEVIPAPGELTNEDIRRIKKGISNESEGTLRAISKLVIP